jgi:hypothetical protein
MRLDLTLGTGGAESSPVYGHLGGEEPTVKPALKGRFIFLKEL